MTEGRAFDADYFDGRESALRRVRVVVNGERLLVRGGDVLREERVSEARIQPRLARLPLRITLPGGAVLIADADAVAAAMPMPPAAGLAHRLESHVGVVLGCLAGLVAAGWFGYHDGIPWLARRVAERLPPEIESQIAEEGLKSLDGLVFKRSALEPARQAHLRDAFAQLSAGLGPAARGARLEFRDGGWIGANAFALPGGVVVMTDQLASLLDDERVLAVLAHELGHLEFRHGTRNILQDSMVGLASMALFGDASAVASFAAAAPTALVHTGYSRDFEREADQFAFGLLRRTGRSPRLLGQALAALEKARDEPAPAQECRAPGSPPPPEEPRRTPRYPRSDGMDYLSTHPATEERIRAAEEASR